MATTEATAAVGECAYCGASDVADLDPRAMDEADWEAAAAEHREGCEWVETRAHTRYDHWVELRDLRGEVVGEVRLDEIGEPVRVSCVCNEHDAADVSDAVDAALARWCSARGRELKYGAYEVDWRKADAGEGADETVAPVRPIES